MENLIQRLITAIRTSRTVRLVLVVSLALFLQIPIMMTDSLVRERASRRDDAVSEVSSKWGTAQSVTGPVLVVPYTCNREAAGPNGQPVVHVESRQAIFLPSRLDIRGDVASQALNRGIFSIPVYRADLTLEGVFKRPDFQEAGIETASIDWPRAQLAIGISDVRAIQKQVAASWLGKPVEFLPGQGLYEASGAGIHAGVPLASDTQEIPFSIPLSLNGSQRLSFVPFSRETKVELTSNSPNPSFQGNWLPTHRDISATGFKAVWSIPFLGRNYPQAWSSANTPGSAIEESRFGFSLLEPVDHYRMSARSVKYAWLFVFLSFGVVWLIEVMSGVRVHPIQYLLLGGALCMFYLLELSLSEHIGFLAAYGIASVAVVAMVGAYSLVGLRRASRAAVIGAATAGLYAYLYILLTNEDYALLVGALVLFAILAGIMFITRKVNWDGAGAEAPVSPVPPMAT